MLLFSLRDISIAPKGVSILHQLSLEVYEGEHWAIVGNSGAGKSVLLQYLAGRFHNIRGEEQYSYFDRFITQCEKGEVATVHRGQLAVYVSSEHDFYTLSNTRDFYYQQRYNASDSDDAFTVAQYLQTKQQSALRPSSVWNYAHTVERLQLEMLLDEQVIKLSNGESKRLKIAGALLRNPKILLLDNPLVGLDVSTRAAFSSLIDEITQSGITVIMVATPDGIPDSITHVATMNKGTITGRCRREEYHPHHVPEIVSQFDRTEADSLLENYPVPHFDSIASLNKVNVRYGEKTIIDQLSWNIAQGDRWALSGRNGSGKSTLLSLLAGDHPQAYANDISLFGRKRGSGESIWDIKRNIGFVSPELQQYFPQSSTCLHAIESGFYDTNGLFRPSDPQKTALAVRWLRVFGIEPYANCLLRNVPMGVQRLCLLIRALVKKPPLFILDEPCQGLDETYRAQFGYVMECLGKIDGMTYIYVTHYEEELPSGVNRYLNLTMQD